jgi:hypothetical protein
MEVEKQSEGKRLLELKMVGLQRNASEPKTCSLGVVLAEGRRIEVRRETESSEPQQLLSSKSESSPSWGVRILDQGF